MEEIFNHPKAVAASLEATEKLVFHFKGEFGETKLYENEKNEFLKVVYRNGVATAASKWKTKPGWWQDILSSKINQIKN